MRPVLFVCRTLFVAGQWQGRTIKADGFNFTCLLAASKGMK
jgi:hypothetical protein